MLPASRFPGQNLALLAAIALVVVWSAPLHGQVTASVQDIDLAVEGPGDLDTEAVAPASIYSLQLHHLVPRRVTARAYTITLVVRTDTLDPLRTADLRLPTDSGLRSTPLIGKTKPASCNDIAVLDAVLASDTEGDTKTTVAALESQWSTIPETCEGWVRTYVIGATDTTVYLPALRRGQSLTVTISTQMPGGTSRQWRRVYSTGPRGRWTPVYSFAFIGRAINESRYFAKQSGAAYILTKEHKRDWVDFVPAVFFSWTPGDADLGKTDWNFTGGLGFDMTAPVVMIGAGTRYNENIMVSLGIALHRQQVLLGKYKGGDTLSENLTEAQLHSPNYRPNPYLSIGFRFGANPFTAP